jgi:energy-coupling factor transporter ATP-binding protein EcfA2
MRPRELTIRGFRSYRDEATFDLRDRHLVGIVGPIGAGKSTVLDAIAFALFGKTPRVQRDTRSLINQLADAAHVQLVFEVDGATWRVTRVLKRKGQGQVQLVRLEADDPDAAHEEVVLQERPVRDRIDQLLGMDFDTFGRRTGSPSSCSPPTPLATRCSRGCSDTSGSTRRSSPPGSGWPAPRRPSRRSMPTARDSCRLAPSSTTRAP